jgi:hypothetical protein
MKGDFTAFTNYLKQKAVNDGKHLNERTEAFSKHANEVGQLMLTAVNALMKLNADYTKKQIDNLTAEKTANFKKLNDEFAKGKLTKEELDAEKTKLQEKFDADTLALKKKEFERNKKMQIAAALIQGSMAILSALATPPFPLGIALAVVAGVKTALDITKIKNQKFEARSGGVFRNAGIPEGSAHGRKYGEAGIAMYDRMTGQEVGEIEGGEPVMVLSRNTYRNNKPVIDRLLHSSLHKNGAPISMRNGGTLMVSETGYAAGRMFQDGGVIDQEGAYAESSASSMASTGETNAMIEKQSKLNEDIKKASEKTAENSDKILNELKNHTGLLNAIKNKPDSSGSILNAIERLRDAAAKANAK